MELINDISENPTLIDKLTDELDAAKTYWNMANRTDDMYAAECLKAAAQDECLHAQLLCEMIQDDGQVVPDNIKDELNEVVSMTRKFHK